MPRTTGLGVKGKTTIGGALHSQSGKGGAITPGGAKALYPGSKATNPKVSSVGAIPVATPKAGKRPNVQPL